MKAGRALIVEALIGRNCPRFAVPRAASRDAWLARDNRAALLAQARPR